MLCVGEVMAEAISLQWNCGVVIKDLSQCKRGQLRNFNSEIEQEFKSHFDLQTFHLPDNLFQADTNGRTPFQSWCKQMLNAFSKPWNKATERAKYLETFSLQHGKPYYTANKLSIHSLHAVLAK